MRSEYSTIVIGGGHAGVEAAWAAANLLPVEAGGGGPAPPTVALVTLDPAKIGVMSCNPAIGGLAKGQIVREIDAMGGLMGLATDATGIQFKVLNTSKGAAVHGPRAQCDKHAYARAVQALIASRPEIQVIAGTVEDFVIERGRVQGVVVRRADTNQGSRCTDVCCDAVCCVLSAPAVVLTTGTFMRGLMHTGEHKTAGGRFGEGAAVGISGALSRLGFELGRLKTGTPPRLERSTIDWSSLQEQWGDDPPSPFSQLSGIGHDGEPAAPSLARFPALPQVDCRVTTTTAAIHDLIRANLHRAPMYSGQIESIGPRYCPSIEDKVVRFAERTSHHVYLEPESLTDSWVYCNGISTSLPADVQDRLVRLMPGCERARILRHGYAVEYDMVRPHQITASGMTRAVEGLFLAGQINGTSGYEEAAGQGLVAGINAARLARGHEPIVIGRERAYLGVMMDDLVTKTPTEPYRMFTSRAEHRLLLRADNAPDRLTPLAQDLGLLANTPLGRLRHARFERRRAQLADLAARIDAATLDGRPLRDVLRRPGFTPERMLHAIGSHTLSWDAGVPFTAATDAFYAAYVDRSRAHLARTGELERRHIPATMDFSVLTTLRTEARLALQRLRPQTLAQAGRLEGITPADLTLLSVLVRRHRAQP